MTLLHHVKQFVARQREALERGVLVAGGLGLAAAAVGKLVWNAVVNHRRAPLLRELDAQGLPLLARGHVRRFSRRQGFYVTEFPGIPAGEFPGAVHALHALLLDAARDPTRASTPAVAFLNAPRVRALFQVAPARRVDLALLDARSLAPRARPARGAWSVADVGAALGRRDVLVWIYDSFQTDMLNAEYLIPEFPGSVFHVLGGHDKVGVPAHDSMAFRHSLDTHHEIQYQRFEMRGQNCFLVAFLNTLHVLLACNYPGVASFVDGIVERVGDANLACHELLEPVGTEPGFYSMYYFLFDTDFSFGNAAWWTSNGQVSSNVDLLDRHPALVNLPAGTHFFHAPHTIAALFPFAFRRPARKLVPLPIHGTLTGDDEKWYYCLVPYENRTQFAIVKDEYFRASEACIAPAREVAHAAATGFWESLQGWHSPAGRA